MSLCHVALLPWPLRLLVHGKENCEVKLRPCWSSMQHRMTSHLFFRTWRKLLHVIL